MLKALTASTAVEASASSCLTSPQHTAALRALTTSSARLRLTGCPAVRGTTDSMVAQEMMAFWRCRARHIEGGDGRDTASYVTAYGSRGGTAFTTDCSVTAMRQETGMSRSRISKAPASTITSTATKRATPYGAATAWMRLFRNEGK